MVSYGKRLACLLVGGAVYPAVFLLSVLIQYGGTVFPPGIDQPLKARICQTMFITGLMLGILLEELGLSSIPDFLRFWTKGIPPCKDLSLVIQNQKFDGVPVRIYSSRAVPSTKRKAVLYFHGGGGILGSVDFYERILCHVAKEGDATVVAVGYGLAPENPYPNQYTECLKAAVYLMKHSEDYGVDSSRIIISGDSCGANFATRICQLLVDRRDLPKVHAQVLIYPGLQALDFSLPSYQQNCKGPLLWKKLVAYLCCRYLNKSTSFVNELLKSSHVPKATRLKYQKWLNANNIPEQFKVRGYREQDHALSSFNPQLHEEMKEMLSETFSPLLAEDAVVCKLPQTFLLTCEFDVLRDDGLLYMKRLIDNAVPVTWSHVENGMHGIMALFGYDILSFPSAKRIVHDVTDFIRRL
ncbi:arylacetamide deacetylase-like 3 [Protobothrops mucrosquamatus]|uniref:arylacetamide deacetylase-like 3 n=1 Tax=Protobothrops mucrosquamatus TaxID=103944 RepID=UPI000775F3B1|nr:arylacetamide deacetylase-like 3 [Protobothrops mucrosquamatus]